MYKKIVWLMLSCLMVVALVLTSCRPAAVEEKEEAVLPEEEEEVVPEEEEEEEVVVPAKEEPQYGGTLTVLQWHCALEPGTFDPVDRSWLVEPYTSPYMENLAMGDFEKYGPRGTNEFTFTDMEFIPTEYLRGCLAESWEFPDPNTVIYHLRKGVYFPDKPGVMASRELTADDVVFCINRQLDSPRFSSLDRPYYDYATALDKYTVALNWTSYYANWTLPFTWGFYCKIYPPEAVDADMHDWKNAVGTGPFMLTDYVSGASLTFERNPIYWDTSTIDGKEYKLPFVDRLVWPIIVDTSTQLAALRTGKCDIEESVGWTNKEPLEETNPDLKRYRALIATFGAIACRQDVAELPFSDIRIRKAMSMAIDRQSIIETQMGGDGELLGGPYSFGWPRDLYTPFEELPESAKELFEYNPEKAKQLMAEAGYPDGFKAEMVILSLFADTAALVVDYWSELGIEIDLKPCDYAVFLGIQYGKAHKHIYFMFKGCSTPYHVLWGIGRPGGPANTAIWDDQHFIDTHMQARTTPDVAEAKRLLKGLNVYTIEQCPYIIMPVSYDYAYCQPWVFNWYGEWNCNGRSPGQIHARVWLDRDLKYKLIGQR